MKLQDLSLEQLKEIEDGAPDGAETWIETIYTEGCASRAYYKVENCRVFVGCKKYGWEMIERPFASIGEMMSYWTTDGFTQEKIQSLNLSDIRARIAELEAQSDINVTLSAESADIKAVDGSEKPVFKVGDRVVILQGTKTLDERYVQSIDDVDNRFALISGEWIYLKNLRHATPEEEAAGHRIDEPASSCGMTAAEIDQFGEDLRNKPYVDLPEFEQPDTITAQLDPAKCRVVDPALPYDEPLTDQKIFPAPMTDGELHALIGQKHDQGKPRYSLIPSGSLEAIVDVLEYGATKYAPDGWKHVENARERYYNAAMRHLQQWWSGEWLDSESGLPHLAHVACCVMFLIWLGGEGASND